MGRISFLSGVPDDVIYELNQKIVDANYGDSMKLAEWFKGLGYKVSKTAMHRYIMALKERNEHGGRVGSLRLYANMSTADNHLALLYQELGQIEFRRQEIIERIRNLTGK